METVFRSLLKKYGSTLICGEAVVSTKALLEDLER
jgi:hypothetical protein